MKQWMILILAIMMALPSAIANPLSTEIKHYLSDLDDGVAVGIYVADVNGKVLYQKHADRQMIPASLLKWVTGTLAYHYMGPDYRFKTRLSLWGKAKEHNWSGPMLWTFSGDPTLTTADIKHVYDALRKKGVKTFSGDQWLDDRVFDRVHFGPGWMWDELNDAYAAPISGANLDHNAFILKIKPSRRLGEMAGLSLPSKWQTHVTNQVRTVMESDQPCSINVQHKQEIGYVLEGCIAWHKPQQSIDVAIHGLREYVEMQQRLAAQSAGLGMQMFSQNWLTQRASKELEMLGKPKQILVHTSQPLSVIISDMLNRSDNLIAESIFKTMGRLWFPGQGSWRKSRDLVKIVLRHALPVGHFRVVDGSGLSRYNHISPRQLAWFLNMAYQRHQQSLIQALPRPGQGTLSKRLLNLKALLQAKTGSMTGVKNIMGYIKLRHKPDVIFVVMLNGIDDQALTDAHLLADGLVQTIAKHVQ